MNSAWVGAKVLKQWVLIQCFHCTIIVCTAGYYPCCYCYRSSRCLAVPCFLAPCSPGDLRLSFAHLWHKLDCKPPFISILLHVYPSVRHLLLCREGTQLKTDPQKLRRWLICSSAFLCHSVPTACQERARVPPHQRPIFLVGENGTDAKDCAAWAKNMLIFYSGLDD